MKTLRLSYPIIISCLLMCLLVISSLVWHEAQQERQDQKNQILIDAVCENDVSAAVTAIAYGSDPNVSHEQSLLFHFHYNVNNFTGFNSPRVEAVSQGNINMVRLLLQHGVDVNLLAQYQAPYLEGEDISRYTYTALEVANFDHSLSIIRLLKEAGAKE